VSFNIGRIRTPYEPRNAAWSRYSLPTTNSESFVDGSYKMCHRDSGCMFTMRRAKDENREYNSDRKGKRRLGEKLKPIQQVHQDEADADDTDDDWVPKEDEEENEPLEYDSDHELTESVSEQEDGDAVAGTIHQTEHEISDRKCMRQFWMESLLEDKEARERLHADSERYCAWYRGVPSYVSPLPDQVVEDEMFPLFYPGRDDASEHGSDASFECAEHVESSKEWKSAKLNHWHNGKRGYHNGRDVEHIAGPRCEDWNGYSGYDISVEEMRGCQTAQCLVRKPRGLKFEPLPDDQDFEKDGDFFLSGLTDHMPSRDSGFPQLTPARHNCDEPHAENCMWSPEVAHDYALPFHPSCFEIFNRTTLHLYGHANVNALTSWWSLDAGYDEFHRFPRDPNVSKCAQQDWFHHRGTAYLVANPLFVPRLSVILEAAIDRSSNFSPQHSAFQVLHSDKSVNDPFHLLPTELLFEILDQLPSKDIASLRLSSRVLSGIPISYFRKLILRDMPWLWEAWGTPGGTLTQMPYSSWTTITAYDAKLKMRKSESELAGLSDYVDIVKQEMPELAHQVDEDFARRYQEIVAARKRKFILDEQDRTPFYLPPNETNYFTLYTLITRHWSELQGLQNRRRIWTDCEEILRRVEAYRKEGKVDEKGITEELQEVVRQRLTREFAEMPTINLA
jgi:hypothetical protein